MNDLKTVNNGIINTMVSQLGGNRFFAMTGSKPQYKDISNHNPHIALKLARNGSKANYLKIHYKSGSDLYRMEFIRMTRTRNETIKEYDGIYGDQLSELFTEYTGLYAHL